MTDDKLVKLAQQLVMTPQLHLAIRMLTTKSAELPALIETHLAAHPGSLVPLDGPDPLDREATEDGDAPYALLETSPFGDDLRGDVFVFGNPPQVRANGRGFPRYRVVGDQPEARWLVRALRQRARTFEKIVGALVAAGPAIAIAHAGDPLAPVAIRELAKVSGLHESTITRVVSAVTLRNLHGVFALAATKRGVTLGAQIV